MDDPEGDITKAINQWGKAAAGMRQERLAMAQAALVERIAYINTLRRYRLLLGLLVVLIGVLLGVVLMFYFSHVAF